MWRVLFRLRLFFLLFETAGMPSLATLMRSALTLGLWLGLSTLTALPVQTVFCLVVLFWFAAGHLLHWRTTIEKMNRRKNRLTPRAFAVVFILTIGLALLAPDPSWVQHLVTFTIAMHAFACLSDMFDKEATFGHFWWPGKEIDHVRPTLTLVFFLKHVAFALLNETMIAVLPVEAWLVWLAMLPIIDHFVTSVVTTTVLLDAGEPD